MQKAGTICLVAPSRCMAVIRDDDRKFWLAPFDHRGKFVLDKADIVLVPAADEFAPPKVDDRVLFSPNENEPHVGLLWAPNSEYAPLLELREREHRRIQRDPMIHVFRKGEPKPVYKGLRSVCIEHNELESFRGPNYTFKIEIVGGWKDWQPPPPRRS